MREIELWTANGFVAVVDIPLFPDSAMPDVVMWNSRVFRRDTGWFGMRWKYLECSSVYSMTPSPGRPQETEAPSSNFPVEVCGFCGETSMAVARSAIKTCSARGDNAPHAWRRKATTEEVLHAMAVAKGSESTSIRDRAMTVMREIDATASEEASEPRSGGLRGAPPVDRSARCTVGEAVAPGVANTEDRGDGQQKGYVVLCDEERAKGFVRPVRRTYLHEKCGMTTTMGVALAETYARDPEFYSGTFCCTCGGHYPVGANGEFVWEGTTEKVGT